MYYRMMSNDSKSISFKKPEGYKNINVSAPILSVKTNKNKKLLKI